MPSTYSKRCQTAGSMYQKRERAVTVIWKTVRILTRASYEPLTGGHQIRLETYRLHDGRYLALEVLPSHQAV